MCSEQMNILITGHLDGTNTPKQEALLEEHLCKCDACRRLLNEYKTIDAELSEMTLTPPAGFSASVMNAISQEAPLQKKTKKHPFRYGTMIAAAAAVLVLAVSAGHISMPKGGSAAIYSMSDSEAAAEEQHAQVADMVIPESESYSLTTDSKLETKTASGSIARLPANVDCAALANTEECYVGLLYADSAPEALKHASSLPLDGGTMYTISQETLNELKAQYPELQIYAPEDAAPEESKDAYLILVNDPA